MIYMGSKNRIAKNILPIILGVAKKAEVTMWLEPFVGGGNMIDKVPSSIARIGSDSNPHVIEALKAVRDFPERIPDSLTEEEYNKIKGTKPDPINSYLRFACSFGAKLDNGYARCKGSDATTYAGRAKRNALKQSPLLKNVDLICADYSEWNFRDNKDTYSLLIYCDPPYAQTTSYKTDEFDHSKFWQWCREMSVDNLVFVSEYSAPEDFQCVWEGELKTNFASQRGQATHQAVEKLFTINNKYL
jgi:DNA adenine methylase